MAGFSFGTQGALPTIGSPGFMTTSTPATTPQARALAGSSPQIGPSSLSSLQSAGIIPAPSQQPVKNTTVTLPDGSSHSTTYQPTTSGMLNNPPTTEQPYGSYPPGTAPTQYQTPNGTIIDAQGNVISIGTQNQNAINAGSTNATNAANGTGTTFPGLIGELASVAGGNQAIGQQAENIGAQYAPQIAAAGTQAAAAAGALESGAGGSQPLQGTALAQEQLGAAREQALGTAEQAALAGTGQQLTAQSQEQQGLGAAATATAPTGSFPFTFNPSTGQFTSGAPGASGTTQGAPTLTYNPQTDATALAADVIAGKIPYSDAVSAMGYAPNVGTGLLQTAITAQGGNVTQLQAQAAATQSNIGTTETAATQAENTAYTNAVQNVSKSTAQYTAATGVATNLTNTLGAWTQSGQLTNLNQAINTVAGLTSSPQYAQFQTALTNTQAAYAAAFQTAGITPTQSTTNALLELNPNSSATAIVASLNQLSSDLHAATVVPAYAQQSTYAQELGISQ